jgi:hypothetical protein
MKPLGYVQENWVYLSKEQQIAAQVQKDDVLWFAIRDIPEEEPSRLAKIVTSLKKIQGTALHIFAQQIKRQVHASIA